MSFNWDELIRRIQRKNVVPVIGQGLYRVETPGSQTGNQPLYHYLAQQLAGECGYRADPKDDHIFANSALAYLKENSWNYIELSEFLKEKLKGLHLVPNDSLSKLARIKAFDLFITTAYDHFLESTLNTVRTEPTTSLYYTLHEKDLESLDKTLFNDLKESRRTLVYHVFGHLEKSIGPAYTEKDILETIVSFQKDMETQRQNQLFRKLESGSLLFMGCGYDDWLFRFFIRTIANEPFETSRRSQTCTFVGDCLNGNKEILQRLHCFLKDYDSEVFYSEEGIDFVDLLFEKLEEKEADNPGQIILPDDFPEFVFISFEGQDREIAGRLAKNLREDGIQVWMDERNFKPGDEIDPVIINAIDRCPVFMPIISSHSQTLETPDHKLKYHCREWERAYGNRVSDPQKVTITPVKIDQTQWMYDKFQGHFYCQVPGGNREGEYNKLKTYLHTLQQNRQQG